ncbi:MAG: phosphonate metabolism transcriptional regulator PhnF [Cyanobacteria bacterium J06639_1]
MTSTHRIHALPVYIQIAEELRQNVESGIYRVGDQLPTEAQLSDRFNVNRHTLRRAIAMLRDEGLLRVDRGRGTFVAAKPIRYPIGKRVRFNEALKAHGKEGGYRLLRASEVPVEGAVARNLNLPVGASAVVIERIGLADGQPIDVTNGYFPSDRFPDLVERAQNMKSLSKLLREEYDCDHIRRSTCVSARTVKPNDARILGVPLNSPILLVESINCDRDGTVVEYGVTRFRGDSMELLFTNS